MGKLQTTFDRDRSIIYVVALLVGAASGIIGPLGTTMMSGKGAGVIEIGLISSLLYGCIAITASILNRISRDRNLRQMVVVGLIIAALGAAAFPFPNSPVLWGLCVAAAGIGIGTNMVGLQTAVQYQCDERERGVVSGIYAFSFGIGFIVSNLIAPRLYLLNDKIPFFMAMLCFLIATTIVAFALHTAIVLTKEQDLLDISRMVLPMAGAFTYGFIETVVITLYPYFLIHLGSSTQVMGISLAGFVLGGLLSVVPITYLSDRFGRRTMLVTSVLLTVISMLYIADTHSIWSRLLTSFICGVGVGPIYAIGLALIGDLFDGPRLSRGVGLFTSAYGVGAAVGPCLSALTMHFAGVRSTFWLSVLVCLALLLEMGLVRLQQSRSLVSRKEEEKV